MAYTHEEIIAKHKRIHDLLLDELEEMAEKRVKKGIWNVQGMVDREWELIVKVEERAASQGTSEKAKAGKRIGWDDLDDD